MFLRTSRDISGFYSITSVKGIEMKVTFHKACGCQQCRRGINWLHRNLNERKLRRMSKKELIKFIKGEQEDVFIAPISSPYSD